MERRIVCMVLSAVFLGACMSEASRELTQEAVKPRTLVLPGTSNSAVRPELPSKYAAIMAGNTYTKTGQHFTDPSASTTAAVLKPTAVATAAIGETRRPTAAAVMKPNMKKSKAQQAKVLVWPGPVAGEEDLPRP